MQKIEISSRTIVFTVFFLLFLRFLFQVKELVFSLFIAFIISGALKTPVDFLEKRKFPRLIASLLVYLSFIFIIINLFAIVIPPLLGEIVNLFKNLPSIVQTAVPSISNYFDLSLFTQNVPNLANEAVNLIKSFFSNAIFITSTLFFGFYLLLEKAFIGQTLSYFFEKNEASRISLIIEKGQKKAGNWFWGEVILMTVVGGLTFIGLILIGMKYAVALAVLAGLLEVIPNLGPIVATIPAALIGFSQSYVLGFSNIALYFIVQQLENNLLVPIVMKKIIGLHPIITLIALVIGGKLAGFMGVLLAVPTTILIQTVLSEWQKRAR